jgi:hypothetical protein
MARCAGVASCKGSFVRKHLTRDSDKQETCKGQTEKRYWKGPKLKIGIKDSGTRWQLRLKIERTSDGFNRKTSGLQFKKQAARISSRLQQIRNWTVWRGHPPPNLEILLAALVQRQPDIWDHRNILGNFAPAGWKKEENLWTMVRTWTKWNLIKEPLRTSWP